MRRLSWNENQHDRRCGQSLILMFLILVALIGVMALTLDYGFVLLARRQMQTGVNAAAKEGLRGMGDPATSELDRRESARELLQLNYDDDFDLTANNTNVGAGIDSSLIQRDPSKPPGDELYAYTIGGADTTLGQDLANRSNFVYRPNNFQLNEGNEIHGDMVVGQYVDSLGASPRPISGDLHEEFSSYQRMDFRTSDETDYETSEGDDAFLVRMRRTHNPDGLDEVADVSSRGGGLPLLLARGGWMNAEDASTPYSVRRDGVTVRGTAIASARNAKSVGTFDGSLDLPGAPHLALEVGSWGIFAEASARPAQIDAQGILQTVAVAYMTDIITAGSPAVVEVPASQGFPDPENNPSEYFDIRIDDQLYTVSDISGINWTITPEPPNTSGQIRADESVVGVHLSLQLLASIPDGSSTTIQVNASDDFIDPDGDATAAFQIQIDIDDASQIETLTVTDIDDDDPTMWTVSRGAGAGPHLANEEVRIPFARSLASNMDSSATQISVQSVLTPIDPDGIPALYYLVTVDDETLRVTDISDDASGFPTMWTVERGAMGTTPADHSDNDQVRPLSAGAVIGMVRVGSGGTDDSSTQITVDTSEVLSSFRDPDNMPRAMYRVRIDNEVLLVRDIDETDDTLWTVERGVASAASAHAANAVVSWAESVSFGDEAKPWEQFPTTDAAIRAQLSAPVTVTSFVPIYQADSVQAYSNRVVAFGGAFIDSTSGTAQSWDFPSSNPTRLGITIAKQARQVVLENGTATWPNRFARDVTTVDLSDLIEFLHAGHQQFDNAVLLAPALVRSIH